jgi:hypothetical protein
VSVFQCLQYENTPLGNVPRFVVSAQGFSNATGIMFDAS